MAFSNEDYVGLNEKLQTLGSEKYKAFQDKLIPGMRTRHGVRAPELRRIAKSIMNEDWRGFLDAGYSDSFEMVSLRCLVTANVKCSAEERIAYARRVLPEIDNWALCDTLAMDFVCKKEEDLPAVYDFITEFGNSKKEYEKRFLAVMLLSLFTADSYIGKTLCLLRGLGGEYYSDMAAAWAICECFIKQRDKTIAFFKSGGAERARVNNKAIGKLRKSFRVSEGDKELLLSFRRSEKG